MSQTEVRPLQFTVHRTVQQGKQHASITLSKITCSYTA